MPATITVGHVLLAAALLAALWALAALVTMLRHRAYGRGTPQYARARDARRAAFYAVAVALLLILLAWLTPLGGIAVAGGRA